MRRLAVAIGLGAMLAASVPAEAQDRHDRRAEGGEQRRDGPRGHHHRRDRHRGDDAIELSDTATGVVVGALVIGGLAALFGGRKKAPVAPEPLPAFAADTDPERVASACAVAAEAEGRRRFAIAQAGEIRSIMASEVGFAVEGDILLRTGWQQPGERRGFRCIVDPQAVRSVRIDDVAALPALAAR